MTPIVTDHLQDVVVTLRDAGRRLALVSLEEKPPPSLHSVVTYHLPLSLPVFQLSDELGPASRRALRASGLLGMETYRKAAPA